MPENAFRYVGFEADPGSGTLRCSYEVGGLAFTETVEVEGGDWTRPGVDDAARLVFLLAGVSYFKAFAPPVLDLGSTPMRPGDRELVLAAHVDGLGEFAYRNGLDLTGLELIGGQHMGAVEPAPGLDPIRPLVPFGGGIDSIVSVEIVKAVAPDAALFVVSKAADRFAAIEDAALVTGLPVVRATRQLDPQILRSRELGFLNGHVPVTGILSAIAVLAAALHGRDAVVMSNERSASSGNVVVGGREVNHQWSKSLAFERLFRTSLQSGLGGSVQYFSLLRAASELWVGRRLAGLPEYLPVFRSCNRAFHIDPAARLDHWCGRCDKCAFVDLVLSPFVPKADLDAVFGGAEPLDDLALLETFRALLDLSGELKPFECVGDVEECRTAAVLAAARPDRADSPVLEALVTELGPDSDALRAGSSRLFGRLGEHHVPEAYATAAGLV